MSASLSDGQRGPVPWPYRPVEIVADGVVHAVGLVSALAGIAVLVGAARGVGDLEFAAILVYGAALVAAFSLSAAYNLWPVSGVKWWLRRFDHASIFVLIAGTYTPFITQMRSLSASLGLLAWMWGVALAGVALKFALPGRYDRATIVVYVALSFSGVAFLGTFLEVLPASTLWLLLAGGVIYVSGIAFHLWDGLPFQNAIWHAFVVAAAASHYAAVLDCMVLSRA